MLARRLRRRLNINPASGQCIVFAGSHPLPTPLWAGYRQLSAETSQSLTGAESARNPDAGFWITGYESYLSVSAGCQKKRVPGHRALPPRPHHYDHHSRPAPGVTTASHGQVWMKPRRQSAVA